MTFFHKSYNNKWIGGVCSGIARAMRINPIIIRFAFVILIFTFGIGILLYLVLFFAMPDDYMLNPDFEMVSPELPEHKHKKIEQPKPKDSKSSFILLCSLILIFMGTVLLSNQFFPLWKLYEQYWKIIIGIMLAFLGILIVFFSKKGVKEE